MQALDNQTLKQLVNATGKPCVSIYLPTHRHHPGTAEDPIRFKNLLKTVEAELAKVDGLDVEAMLAEYHQLLTNTDFWNHQLDTLALFKGDGVNLRLRIPRPLNETVEVADSFHVKPLIRLMQSAGRFQVLCLAQKTVDLYEGDRDSLNRMPLHPDVPKTLTGALGAEYDDVQFTMTSHGGLSGAGAMHHGQHERSDERDIDLERYFRAVDKAVWEHHSRRSGLPLYLVTLGEYQDMFHKVSHNTNLQPERINIHPERLDVERLRKELEPVVLAQYHAETDEVAEAFGTAKAQGKGSDDLTDVAVAAMDGRVLMLLVDADMKVGGRVSRKNRNVERMDHADPSVDDVLDDIAELVLGTDGRVLVLPHDKMPSKTGIAAAYRY